METEKPSELRILLLEDTPEDAEIRERELRNFGFVFVSQRVDTRDMFIQALDKFKPDIILADFNLLHFDILSALEIVQRDHPDVPVIIVSSVLSDSNALTLIKAGARDYILKDRLARLPSAILNVIEHRKNVQHKNRLLDIINLAPELIAYISAIDRRILFLNKGGRRMCGIAEDEDVTKVNIREFHPEWAYNLICDEAIPKAIKDGSWTGEIAFLNRSGQEIPVLMTINAHKGPHGEISILSTITHDISARKLSEAKLEKSNADLKLIRQDLELSLERQKKTYQQIITSEKMAGLGQLTAGVCHEILNPLNVISLHAQILSRRKNIDKDIASPLAKINDEVQRIVKIVNTLMDFSRKREPELKIINLETEIEKVLALIEKDLSLDNIKLIRDFVPQLPELFVDPDQIRQVFFNILNNAHYAMLGKEGCLTVSIKRIDSPDGRIIRIKFADTGTGIKKEIIDKLFNPFFTTKPEGHGTGLGLSVTRTIIENHRGKINVESEEGKGTTFIIDLPATKGQLV